jgi:hypothetical protein
VLLGQPLLAVLQLLHGPLVLTPEHRGHTLKMAAFDVRIIPFYVQHTYTGLAKLVGVQDFRL